VNAAVKKTLISLLKYGVSIGIIVWLVTRVRADDPEAFSALWEQPKDWLALTAACFLCTLGAAISIVRWYFLVRALELPFTITAAFRLGALGFLLNLVSVGSVGGDLFKAVFIAREQPGRRTQAVATVAIDRMIGLHLLFVMASAGVLLNGLVSGAQVSARIVEVSWLILAGAVVGTIVAGAMLAPGFSDGRLARFLSRTPRIGGAIGSLFEAVRLYRRRVPVLALAAVLSVGVHASYVIGIFAVARGLPGLDPTLGRHFAIVPVSMLTGILPLPMGSLGAFEFALDYLYQHAASVAGSAGQGLMVALGYRVITVMIAAFGLCFFLVSRREITEVMHEAAGGGATD
jgi:hypothetical protein